MSIRYRFYLLDENSRVLGSLHGDFATDDAAVSAASAMLKGSLGVEAWQEERLVGRFSRRRETVDEVAAVPNEESDGARL